MTWPSPNIGPRFLAIAAIGVATVIACAALTLPPVEILRGRTSAYDRPLIQERLNLPAGFPVVWSVPPFVVCYSPRSDALLRDDGNGLRLIAFSGGKLVGRFAESAEVGAADPESDLIVTVDDRILCSRSDGSAIARTPTRLAVASATAFQDKVAVAEWDRERQIGVGRVLIWNRAENVASRPDLQLEVPRAAIVKFSSKGELGFCGETGVVGVLSAGGKVRWTTRSLGLHGLETPAALAWSPNARQITIVSRDGTLMVLDALTGGVIGKAKVDRDTHGLVCLSDGKMLLASGAGDLVLRDHEGHELNRCAPGIVVTGLTQRKGEVVAFHGGYR